MPITLNKRSIHSKPRKIVADTWVPEKPNVDQNPNFDIDNNQFKFYPGHYTKMQPEQYHSTDGSLNTTQIQICLDELKANNSLRGTKIVMHWGSIDNDGDPSTWNHKDWELIKYMLQELYKIRVNNPTLPRKRLLIAITFKNGSIAEAIPPSLRGDATNYFLVSGTGTYFPALYKKNVRDAFNVFLGKFANYVVPNTGGVTIDANDHLAMFSTLESAGLGTIGGSSTYNLYYAGLNNTVALMKANFPKTPITYSLNFDRPVVRDAIVGVTYPSTYKSAPYYMDDWPGIIAMKVGINTPDGNHEDSLWTVSPTLSATPYPGILRYYSGDTKLMSSCNFTDFTNQVCLQIEVQPNDYFSTQGNVYLKKVQAELQKVPQDAAVINGIPDYPTYDALHADNKTLLNAHYTVWQRQSAYWLGNGPWVYKVTLNGTFYQWSFLKNGQNFPPCKNFLLTNEDIQANIYGGMNNVMPTAFI